MPNVIQNSRPGSTASINGVRKNAPAPMGSIPPGGTVGSVLVKMSNADFDYQWMEIQDLINALRNSETGEFLLNTDGSILLKTAQ